MFSAQASANMLAFLAFRTFVFIVFFSIVLLFAVGSVKLMMMIIIKYVGLNATVEGASRKQTYSRYWFIKTVISLHFINVRVIIIVVVITIIIIVTVIRPTAFVFIHSSLLHYEPGKTERNESVNAYRSVCTDLCCATTRNADADFDEVNAFDGWKERRVAVSSSRVHHLHRQRNRSRWRRVTGLTCERKHHLRRCHSRPGCGCVWNRIILK